MKKAIALLCLLWTIIGLSACGGPVAAETVQPRGETVYIHAEKLTTEAESSELPTTAPAESDSAESTEESEEDSREESAESLTEGPKLGLVKEKGKWYYYSEPGVRFKGWLQTSQGYSYFDEARVTGLYVIDGDTYYFPGGIMATGRRVIRGRVMVFDEESGKLLPEETTEAPTRSGPPHGVVQGLLYNQGVLQHGYVQVDGNWYLADEEGRIITGRQFVGGLWRYFKEDGSLAYGLVKNTAGDYYFANEEGILESGFVLSDGVLRYFDPSTLTMLRNTSVGSYQIDGSGICSKKAVEVTDANLDAHIDSILAEIGTSPRAIYEYVSQNYVYVVMGWDTERNMAIHFLNTGYGACIHFCAVTEMLLNRCGYATHWVRGELGHYWLLVEMSPGVWRHMDTMRKNYHVYNLTDAEVLAKHDNPYGVNFHWDASKWTSTTTTGLGDGPSAVPATTPAPETNPPETEPPETNPPETAAPLTEPPLTESPETSIPAESAETWAEESATYEEENQEQETTAQLP